MNSRIYKGIVIALSLLIIFTFCRLEGDIDALRKATEENPVENPDDDPDDNPDPSIPAPNAPIVTASDGMLTVRWTAVEGAENYEVYLGTTQNPPAEPARTVTATTVLFDGLVNKTVYYVWIKAVNENATSDFSPYARGIPWPANEAPATPERPTIIPGINLLTVTWEQPGGASSYEVYVNTTPSTPPAPSVTTDRTSAVIANLENDVIYYIWVRAVNSAGKSGYSPVEAGTPQTPTVAPVAPNRPDIVAGYKELTVSWQAVELTESYEVWLGTTDNSTLAQKYGNDVTGGITEITIIGLINETTYYVWIKAKNVVGASGFSPSASGTPSALIFLPETPSTPLVFWGNRELSVSWQAAEGALFYEMWVGTANNSAQATKYGADVSGTSVTITGLNNGTMYYIWIKAKNNVGTSGFSPMASGKPQALGTPDAPNVTPGLYRGAEKIGNQNLNDSLSYISANAVTGDEFYIILGANESVSPANLNYSGKTVGITLMGYGSDRTITLASDGSMFTVGSGVTFTLEDNITLIGRSANNARLVSVASGGSFTMNDGTISGNSMGGVSVSSNGSFTMNGGTISGNSMDGVSVFSNGTFIMNSGTISGNTSNGTNYGSVNSNGTFTMNGGIISGNSGSDGLNGGNVLISNGTFTMNGGNINGNTGNGVYCSSSGTFTMNGGTISGNTGRGVSFRNHNFIMFDGTINENDGGGVYVLGSNATFTMHGGIISENSNSGVYITADGTFIMNGGTISGNSVRGSAQNTFFGGGGVYVYGTFTMNGGIIMGNSVSVSGIANGSGGGGVCLFGGTFIMYDGIISGNSASYSGSYSVPVSGGGVYVYSGTTFTMHGGTISGNSVSGSNYGGGGGVYVFNNGTFKKLPVGVGQNSGIIYGSEAVGNDANGVPLKNTANSNNDGHAVYSYVSSKQIRNTTAGQSDQIDTTTGKGLSANGNAPFGQ